MYLMVQRNSKELFFTYKSISYLYYCFLNLQLYSNNSPSCLKGYNITNSKEENSAIFFNSRDHIINEERSQLIKSNIKALEQVANFGPSLVINDLFTVC